MESAQKEARILLAIQALKQDPKQSVRSIAKAYNLPEVTSVIELRVDLLEPINHRILEI